MSALEPELAQILEPVLERIVARRLAKLTERSAPGDDELLTAEAVVRLLGVSRWRVYEMIRRQALLVVRPSERTVRLRRGDLRKFMQAQCES